MRFPLRLALAASLAAAPAAAQTVSRCEGWQASVANLVEPWEDNTRTFANGAVRAGLFAVDCPRASRYRSEVT